MLMRTMCLMYQTSRIQRSLPLPSMLHVYVNFDFRLTAGHWHLQRTQCRNQLKGKTNKSDIDLCTCIPESFLGDARLRVTLPDEEDEVEEEKVLDEDEG